MLGSGEGIRRFAPVDWRFRWSTPMGRRRPGGRLPGELLALEHRPLEESILRPRSGPPHLRSEGSSSHLITREQLERYALSLVAPAI